MAYAISGEGDEIVRTPPKDGDNVNPLVPGSSPGGPTKSFIRPEEADRIPAAIFVRKLGVTKERLLDSGLSLEQSRQF